MEYKRIFAGVSPFLSGPGAITPMDWPSMYGTLPPWSMITWHVSQFTRGVLLVMVSLDTQLPSYGALGLKRFQGISSRSSTPRLMPKLAGGCSRMKHTMDTVH